MVAARIIGEYGGLLVGETGPGTEQAASDIHFYTRLGVATAWTSRIGEVAAFATAHHDHMVLLIGKGGRLYVFTEVDGRLYDAGNDFGDLMYRLLFGYSMGQEIPRSEVA